MKYSPENTYSRRHLATILLNRLQVAGFVEESNEGSNTRERVFYRFIDDLENYRLKVYTTIVGAEVRIAGKDAIRVCTVYHNRRNEVKGVGSEVRVNRTGDTEAIAERMLTRMRKAWVDAHTAVPKCHCGAPLFLSTNGNMVCAEFCWKK